MEKLMYLFNFEFKRNFKIYLDIIAISCGVYLFNIISNLTKYNNVMNKILRGNEPTTLTKTIGTTSFENILDKGDMYVFVIGLVICLLYSIIIWKIDLSSKNKSIYTLAMLPCSRGDIYLSKFLNIVCLVYMYVTSFMVVIVLAYNILPRFMEGDVVSLGFAKDTIHLLGMYLPYSISQFITVYVFLLGSVVSIMFTIVLLKYRVKDNFKYIGILILGYIVYVCIDSVALRISSIVDISTTIIGVSAISIIVCTFINMKIINSIDF